MTAALASESNGTAKSESAPCDAACSSSAVVLDVCSSPEAEATIGATSSVEAVKSAGLAQLLGYLLGFFTMPCQLVDFIHSLFKQFHGYVPMVILQYGLNQGFGYAVSHFSMRYYWMDVLGLDGATMGRYAAASRLPWNVKPIVGLLSDAMPLFGYRRTSYLVITAAFGVAAFAMLGSLPLAALATVPLFFLVNVSVAAPDVIIDASTAELSKAAPDRASDLQSLSWGASSVGGLMACAAKGALKDSLGAKAVLLICVVTSAGVLIPGLLRWLPEERLPRGQRWKFDSKLLCHHRGVSALAAFMSVTAVLLSAMQVVVESEVVRGVSTLVAGIVLAVGVYAILRHITPILAKTALFMFVRQVLQPGLGETMFVWLTKSPEGPQFSATMLGWIDCFGSVALLLGIVLYNKYLTKVSYRKIFLIAQIAMVFSNLSDFVLVKRWNKAIGIPDAVFIAGDDAFTLVFSRFFMLPLFVLASKVCPDNLEATLFAMLMSLSNFGWTISDFAGVTLCELFGVVGQNFDMLPAAILTKSACRLLPIPLIFLLVPNLTPEDPIPCDGEDGEPGTARSGEDSEEGTEDNDEGAATPLRSRGGATPKSIRSGATPKSRGETSPKAFAMAAVPRGQSPSPLPAGSLRAQSLENANAVDDMCC